MKTRILVGLAVLLTLSLGCATPGKRTAIGAGAGAAGGAAVGAIAGGTKGALIGAASGAVLGGVIGNSMDRQAQELEKVAQTKRTEDGILVNLKNDLLFDSGSAALKPQAIANLNALGDILAKYPDNKIRVEGYTDDVGTTTFNEDLSKRRAEAVRELLTSRGVRADQMVALGQGKNSPIASNDTPEGRSRNRRVELHIEES
ncbi:OmpA family protein [Bdellovibrionota bacterium FG-2]